MPNEQEERRAPVPETVGAAISTVVQETSKAVRKAERRSRLDLDVRGLLALLVIGGSLGLAGVALAMTNTLELPSWLTGMAGSIVGFYFGSRGGSTSTEGNGNGHAR